MKDNKKKKEICMSKGCEDFPITHCLVCGSFYVLDLHGDRREISIKTNPENEY